MALTAETASGSRVSTVPRAWWWAAASAAGIAVGAGGPWVSVLGAFTERGTDESPGWMVVAAAVGAAVGLALVLRRRRRWLCVLPLVGAGLAVAICAANLYEISTYSDTILGARLEQAEWGLYVALICSSSLVLAVLVLAAQLPSAQRGRRVAITGSDATARIRNPWLVFVLAVATLGAYYLYWYYQANRELKDFGIGRHPVVSVLAVVPGALLIVPPLVSWWRFIGRIRLAEEQAGAPARIDHGVAVALYLVGVLVLPVELVYTQRHLNDVWRQLRPATASDSSTMMLTYAPEPRTAPEA